MLRYASLFRKNPNVDIIDQKAIKSLVLQSRITLRHDQLISATHILAKIRSRRSLPTEISMENRWDIFLEHC